MQAFVNNKHYKVYLSLVLISFLVLQILAIMLYGSNWYLGSFITMDNDDVKYIRSAWILVEKHMLVYHNIDKPTVFIMPGYPLLIALFVKIFGKYSGILALRIFQGILQAVSLYLTYMICKELYNNRTALIAVTLNAVYLPEVVATVLILTETVFKCILMLLAYISIKALKTKKISLYILGGVFWGIGTMVRPTMALFPVVIFIMWLLFRYSAKEMAVRTLIVSGIFLIILSPWWIRNYALFNRFIPFTLSSGNPFLQGTYIDYDQSKGRTGYITPDDAVELDRIEMQTGIQRLKQNFRQNGLAYIYWYTVGKTSYYWIKPFYSKAAFNIYSDVVSKYHFVLLALAFGSIAFIRPSKQKDVLFLVLVILYFNLVYLPYFTCPRYAYPTMPFVIILAAGTLSNLAQICRRRITKPQSHK